MTGNELRKKALKVAGEVYELPPRHMSFGAAYVEAYERLRHGLPVADE